MPMNEKPGDLHVEINHDTGRVRIERSGLAFKSGVYVTLDGEQLELSDILTRKLIHDGPLIPSPARS